MKNLIGNDRRDEIIREELAEAHVSVRELPARIHEKVALSPSGRLYKNGKTVFNLHRARRCWVVVGDVPLEVARALCSKKEAGHDDIRAGGDAQGQPLERWTEWRDELDRVLLPLKEKEECEQWKNHLDADFFDEHVFVENPSAVGRGFVKIYHIDSQEGLNLFVKTLKEHKMVD